MFLRSASSCRRALGTAALAAAFLFVAPEVSRNDVAEAATGLFNGLAGSWAGNGTIKMSNGSTERIRCSGTYVVSNNGDKLQQNLVCKSDSYDLKLRGNLDYKPNPDIITGTWTEATYNTVGKVSGRVRSGQIRASIQGDGFLAQLTMVNRGNQQTVSISSKGSTVTNVSVTLRKSSK